DAQSLVEDLLRARPLQREGLVPGDAGPAPSGEAAHGHADHIERHVRAVLVEPRVLPGSPGAAPLEARVLDALEPRLRGQFRDDHVVSSFATHYRRERWDAKGREPQRHQDAKTEKEPRRHGGTENCRTSHVSLNGSRVIPRSE